MYDNIKTIRKLDANGFEFIKKHEGYRSKAYKDSAGIWTIGYGSIRLNGRAVKHDDVVTEAQAMNQMILDLETFEHAVNEYVTVYLSQRQYKALVSFTYNVGQNAFRNSTLLKKLNKGNYKGAANELKKWVYAGAVRIPGLINRREAERALFLIDVKEDE
ncbi:lysozyme [Vreelandella sedimenti]|uniref:lysozyme n=1 Tax=Vreelandella sedimenti TaxID=2729618 RepID=UPI00257CCF27|nr:lysozyme [Halomonas sp. UBA3173]|tara:strand:- start:154852 stop:155331 length:480 start_codon:yes stop_codon:yes gene_type:complete